MIYPVHTAVRGRARYKVQGLYRSDSLKRRLEQALAKGSGITNYSVSAITGTVLIRYEQDRSPESIEQVLRTIVEQHVGEGGTRGPIRLSITPAPADTSPPSFPDTKLRTLVTHADEQKTEAWHLMDSRVVLRNFGVAPEAGLSDEEARASLRRYGPNVLPEAVPRSALSILLGQFASLPVALLGAAAVVSLATGGIADAVVILGVVAVNAVIGYSTESQAERTIHSLKSLVRPTARVLRSGSERSLPAEEVAVGDILLLRPGTYVAADARLVEADRLSVDESALTGESLPVLKHASVLSQPDLPLADRLNMVYRGTLVTGGQGVAVVTATGRYTEIGRIQTLLGEARPPETPMERQLDALGSRLVLIGGVICGVVFVIGLLRGYGLLQMFKTSISLAVAAVPEGLPTVATTTLALGIRTMRRHRVLIRRLDAVETLGSVQSICLDKTGTITHNRMTVAAVHVGLRRIDVQDGEFLSGGERVSPAFADTLLRLIHVLILCNESEVTGERGTYVVNGSSTENALVYLALAAGVDVTVLRRKHPLLRIVHRSEKHNVMMTVHEAGNGGRLVAIKGSPAEVLSLCSRIALGGTVSALPEDVRAQIERENEHMAGESLRVLGAAYAVTDEWHRETETLERALDERSFIWLGLVGMADPVRKGVPDLIRQFHRAGIDTVMITGDQGPTAYAVGKALNLSRSEELEILDSTHLTGIDPEVLKALAGRVHVFARVSPANKLQIVQALQAAGRVVAMTGDGVNDGPALKAADIGIAMGHTGTDVAREVADVVLEDDNLETMIIAVSQGRTIYSNIRKAVHFLLATNLTEIMVMFAALAGGLGQPLTAMQLLWINLISDIAPGLALALEPPEPDVLSRPPRDPQQPIVTKNDLLRVTRESAVISAGSLGAYLYGLARYGAGPQAGTIAFLTLTAGQLLHTISCRSEHHSIFDRHSLPPNRILTFAVAGSFALQAAAFAVPGLRSLLGLGPVGLLDGAVIAAGAAVPLLVNEAIKDGGRKEAVS